MVVIDKNENHEKDDCGAKPPDVTEKQGQLVKAPDGGWGWMVVFGSFMIHVIADGLAYSFGIYVESFLEHFNASRSEVGFLGSLMLGVTWGTGPIASMLTNKFGCQKVAISGTIIAAVGFFISIFAPNIYFMYFSFGIVAGFGLGMAYLPAIVAVSFYFEKRRSLATGLAVCGSGVGTFVFAPITQLLLDKYGWKGTVLIEVAILLNCIICGAVFRPLPVIEIFEARGETDKEKEKVTSKNLSSEVSPKDEKMNVNGSSIAVQLDVMKPLITTSSYCSLSLRKQVLTDSKRQLKFSSEINLQDGPSQVTRVIPGVSSNSLSLSPMARKDIFYTASLQNIPMFNSNEEEYRRSMINIKATETETEISECRLWKALGCSSGVLSALKDMMDCSLMADIVFLLFSISNLLTSIGLCVPYVFLPNRAKMMNIPDSEGAFLISIIGISNTVGRIVFGFLADYKWVNRLALYNTVLLFCGIASLLSALCYNYPLMATYSAVFGLLIGVYICLTPIVLVDLMGLDKLSNSFGLVLLFQGIGAVIGPPMAGAVYDSTLDYNNSFYLMGVCIAVSGAMLYCIPCIVKLRNTRKMNRNDTLADHANSNTE